MIWSTKNTSYVWITILGEWNDHISRINLVATSLTEGKQLQVCSCIFFHSMPTFCVRIIFAFSVVVSFETASYVCWRCTALRYHCHREVTCRCPRALSRWCTGEFLNTEGLCRVKRNFYEPTKKYLQAQLISNYQTFQHKSNKPSVAVQHFGIEERL